MTDTTTKRKPALRLLLLWNHTAEPADADADAEDDAASASGIQRTLADLSECLSACGYRVLTANAEDDIDRITAALVVERPAIVINLIDELYDDYTQRAAVASYLDLLGYPYLGSDPQCLAICQDRVRTHLILVDADVPVPGFGTIRDINAVPDISELRVPVVITQAFDDLYEDEGVERPIYDRARLIDRAAVLSREFDLPLLVEEWLGSRRVHAIVIGDHPLEVLPLIEAWHGAGNDELYDDDQADQLAPGDDGDPGDAAAEYLAADDLMDAESPPEEEETGRFERMSERVPYELHDDDASERDEPLAGDDDEVTLLRDAPGSQGAGNGAPVELPGEDAASNGDELDSHGEHDDDATTTLDPAGAAERDPAAERGLALAQLEPDTADRVRQLARRAFRAMGCRDIAQIDFHFDDDDQPHVVDVRPNVDLGRDSPFALAARSTHRGYDGVLCELIGMVTRRARLAETGAASGDEPAGGPANGAPASEPSTGVLKAPARE